MAAAVLAATHAWPTVTSLQRVVAKSSASHHRVSSDEYLWHMEASIAAFHQIRTEVMPFSVGGPEFVKIGETSGCYTLPGQPRVGTASGPRLSTGRLRTNRATNSWRETSSAGRGLGAIAQLCVLGGTAGMPNGPISRDRGSKQITDGNAPAIKCGSGPARTGSSDNASVSRARSNQSRAKRWAPTRVK